MPSVAQAAPEWVGDFETGDFSQWTLSAQVISNADNMTVVSDEVYEGEYSARIQVDPGEMSPSGHSRNEVVYVPDQASFEGSERWYAFSLRPGDDPWAETWHLVYYWEGNPVFASVMSMVVVGQQIRFQTFLPGETTHWQGAFTAGQWHDYILHVRWAPDDSGFVELFVDGEQVVPLTNVPTMHGPGVFNEMHTGLLRNNMVDFTEVIHVDGVRSGETMEDVMTTPNPPGGSEGGDSTGEPPGGSDSDETGNSDNGNDTGGPDGSGGNDNADSANDETSTPATGGGPGGSGGSSGSEQDGGGDEGCSCRSGTGSTGAAAWLLGLVALGAGRRRRSA